AQNQYVLVRSTEGEVLLRKPLRQALAGLPQDAGVQVHRSWWVSNRFLQLAYYDARAQELRLRDDPAVPVSKTNLPALQERLSHLQ
ncbi:MAG: LytTR family transcriptional regulator, partial [Rhodobacteraceae bacterium]|nr:LytTR family transcriptional regulator [Paracoccaceae bacterium]